MIRRAAPAIFGGLLILGYLLLLLNLDTLPLIEHGDLDDLPAHPRR